MNNVCDGDRRFGLGPVPRSGSDEDGGMDARFARYAAMGDAELFPGVAASSGVTIRFRVQDAYSGRMVAAVGGDTRVALGTLGVVPALIRYAETVEDEPWLANKVLLRPKAGADPHSVWSSLSIRLLTCAETVALVGNAGDPVAAAALVRCLGESAVQERARHLGTGIAVDTAGGVFASVGTLADVVSLLADLCVDTHPSSGRVWAALNRSQNRGVAAGMAGETGEPVRSWTLRASSDTMTGFGGRLETEMFALVYALTVHWDVPDERWAGVAGRIAHRFGTAVDAAIAGQHKDSQ